MTLAYISSILFVLLIGGAVHQRKKWMHGFVKNIPLAVSILFAAALALRLILAYTQEGLVADINTFKTWGNITNQVGFSAIYEQDIFLDYPPGYLYVLTLLEKIRLFFGIPLGSQEYTFLIKMPAVLGDLFCAGVLLRLARQKLTDRMSLFLTAAYLFCPVILLNSANWGQMDSFCVSFFLLAVLLLYKERYILCGAVYGLSIIIKPQMLTFVPLFIFYVIRKKKYRSLVFAPLAALAVIIVAATPFTQNFNYTWLIEQYAETMNGYSYYSVNAYNFWALIGLNWKALPEKGVVSLLLTAIGPALATAFCGLLIFKSKRDDVVFAAPIILMSVAYMLTVKMHERYIFSILIFILLVFIFVQDRRLIYAFLAVTFTHYLNVRHVLDLYRIHGPHYDPNSLWVKCVSLLQMAALLYLLWLLYDIYGKGRIFKLNENTTNMKKKWGDISFREVFQQYFFRYKHLTAVGAVTLIYAVASFWNLGSHDMPTTAWVPAIGESVVIETSYPADTIVFLPGLTADQNHYRARLGTNVTIETSDDGETWTNQGFLEDASVWAWKEQRLPQLAKFFRFTAQDESVVINEIALRNSVWERYEILTTRQGNGQVLMDEQNIVPLYPTYFDSTYFDEIYHARTAYEHNLSLEPYENTHPPLGKYFIGLGVELFGLNPFGWRFMGTLFGVFMLPLFYVLLRKLFGSHRWAMVGMIIWTLDFMHFTQTRIATIDTYAVFFILAMYTAMVSFCQKDILKSNFFSLCKPLLVSGVFMGIGIASKWTVAYAAVGLAVLLFTKLAVAYVKIPRKLAAERKKSGQRILQICLGCCLFFIIIPFVLYFLAFLPMTALPHQESIWRSFVNYQVNMFRYHAELVAEHPYSSPWYEWPFVIRPIWFFFTDKFSQSGVVSTISSLGNPAVWWVGIPAMLFSMIRIFYKKDKIAFVSTVGFLSVFLPWVLVPRITFIYHYFTAVPFLIISLVLMLKNISKKKIFLSPLLSSNTIARVTRGDLLVASYLFISLGLFILFFPVISGLPSSKAYIDFLEWLPHWTFTP